MNTPPPADALRLVPQDLSRVVESVMHVYQGNHDHLPELLNHAGTLVLKVGRRMSTRQLLIVGGLLAVGALLVIRQVSDGASDKPVNDKSKNGKPKDDNGDKPLSSRSGEHHAASDDKP